ncbi:acetate--CoA ligase family protein [Cupriavidus sp. CV2]|uniref:acetate--CoA ligase family protein n=1 Tax=Cupriavidus ulmosensis TaxID=3065913 RepID=UPI00296B55A3|nr:acetate--CoA ligase family protein [Cupriavidus sp. CV2]MDW3682819.1 acetate--CoA ligase family protein [Cupriavidus sp. CV2]
MDDPRRRGLHHHHFWEVSSFIRMSKFKFLFEPRSIAVVGVSDDANRPGSQVVRALVKNGYAGKIYPVNPKYDEFDGHKCFASVLDIEESVDLVVIGVPAQGAVAVLETCAKKQVKFVVILSGGFRESGPEGIALEQRMLEIAKAAGIRVLGPNCLGFANIHDGVYAAFGSITREPKLKKGGVSLVTQSGGFGYSIALGCAAAGIGFRHVLATGNESDIDTVQLIDALLDDDETDVIVAYLEGTRDGRALLEVGRRALSLGKPILLWKAGITEQGAKAAASHTASMTGSYDFYKALFAQSGIIEIREIHQAVDYLKALEGEKTPEGTGVAVLGVSGGSAIVFADAGEPDGVRLCELTEETQTRLQTVISSIGAVHNPVDLTAGYFSAANREKLDTVLRAVLDDPNVDAVCVNLATTGKAGCQAAAEVMARLVESTSKPMLVFSSAPRELVGDVFATFESARIPVFPSPSRAAHAVAMLANYGAAKRQQQRIAKTVDATSPACSVLIETGLTSLSETDAKRILGQAGIPVSTDVVVQSSEEAGVFETMRAPLVVKVVSPDIAHKTEVGGVKVGIRTRQELATAITTVLESAKQKAPSARISGALVTEMIQGGFELIAGVVNDPVFGPVVVVGAGGIYAELLGDTACRIAPFDVETGREMINSLKCQRILAGARGGKPLDTESAAKALASLSKFAWQNRERVAEVDINPLFVLPEGVVAADAVIIPVTLSVPQ